MKRLMRIGFALVAGLAATHAVFSHTPIFASLAVLFIGLAALDSLAGAMFGVRAFASAGGGWGRHADPNVVGYGLGNVLAPITDPIQSLGQLLQHPSFANLGRVVESPFKGIAQAFGADMSQHPNQQPYMPQPPGAPAYLPAPVPALGPGMTQAHGHPGNARAIVSYMGLGACQWVANGPLTQTLTPEPQAPFIGNRMIITQKASGASTAGIQINITQPLTVSGVPQTPAPNVPAPIEMFAQDATYSALQIQIAAAGTEIAIGFTASANPTGTDLVNLSAGLYGYWLR
jgi:hypothetical protein